jgi:hypothetical protein
MGSVHQKVFGGYLMRLAYEVRVGSLYSSTFISAGGLFLNGVWHGLISDGICCLETAVRLSDLVVVSAG